MICLLVVARLRDKMIPIIFHWRYLLGLALVVLYLKFLWWFDDSSLWIALPIVFLAFLLGIYRVRHASQIINKKRWYNRILTSEAENEKDIKITGYLMIIMSILFSMIAFFLRK